MRIISGKYKGRQLQPPKNLPVRPTTNAAKEGIFNILNNHFDFEDLEVLDLFSGTGNISIEFISRGVKSLTAVDNNFNCCRFLKETGEKLEIDNMQVIKTEVFHFLKSTAKTYDIIYADPPYDMEELERLPEMVFTGQLLKKEGWLIVEHSPKTDLSGHPKYLQHREYGHVNFSIFSG